MGRDVTVEHIIHKDRKKPLLDEKQAGEERMAYVLHALGQYEDQPVMPTGPDRMPARAFFLPPPTDTRVHPAPSDRSGTTSMRYRSPERNQFGARRGRRASQAVVENPIGYQNPISNQNPVIGGRRSNDPAMPEHGPTDVAPAPLPRKPRPSFARDCMGQNDNLPNSPPGRRPRAFSPSKMEVAGARPRKTGFSRVEISHEPHNVTALQLEQPARYVRSEQRSVVAESMDWEAGAGDRAKRGVDASREATPRQKYSLLPHPLGPEGVNEIFGGGRRSFEPPPPLDNAYPIGPVEALGGKRVFDPPVPAVEREEGTHFYPELLGARAGGRRNLPPPVSVESTDAIGLGGGVRKVEGARRGGVGRFQDGALVMDNLDQPQQNVAPPQHGRRAMLPPDHEGVESLFKQGWGGRGGHTPRERVVPRLWTDAEIARVFKKVDVNGSGMLDYMELGLALKELGPNVDEREKQRVLQKFDDDGNGVLDLDEFKDLVQYMQNGVMAGYPYAPDPSPPMARPKQKWRRHEMPELVKGNMRQGGGAEAAVRPGL